MTLEELIQKCKEQDIQAQESLYNKYSGILFAVCLRYSPNYEEAQDNLQDAFLTIFKNIEQFKGKGSFEGWIKRITVNTVLQKYRKQRVYNLTNEGQVPEEIDDEPIEDEKIPLDYLLQIIQELPDRYRLVFTMYVLDGYSHQEIATMMNITTGTTKSNLARARAILKTKVKAYKKGLNR